MRRSHLQHKTYFWSNFGSTLRMNIQRIALILFIGFLFSGTSSAQEPSKNQTRILFIYDASNSMNGIWEGTSKHKLASNLLQETLDSLSGTKNLELALRVYGHQHLYTRGQECNDTKLEVPFGENNAEEIKQALSEVKPRGTTPIALTLEKAAGDFSNCTSCRNIIILITDGIEECDGDPCAAARLLKEKNIRLKPFIIGIGLDESFKKSFDCVGNFYDVTHRNDFEQVLNVVISQALNPTTVQLNLLDENQNPSETNVPFSLYNRTTGELDYHYIHTLNSYGTPDTFFVDPNAQYDLVIHSLPEIIKEGIQIQSGRPNIIGVDVPQGSLKIISASKSRNNPIKALIFNDKDSIINVQSAGDITKYIADVYTLELLTLPRIKQKISVDPRHTTTVEVPSSGLLTVKYPARGYGKVFQWVDNELIWVIDLNSNSSSQSISLLPGKYRAVYRPANMHQTENSKYRDFEIKPDASKVIQF